MSHVKRTRFPHGMVCLESISTVAMPMHGRAFVAIKECGFSPARDRVEIAGRFIGDSATRSATRISCALRTSLPSTSEAPPIQMGAGDVSGSVSYGFGVSAPTSLSIR